MAESDTEADAGSPGARLLARFEALPLVVHVALTSATFFLLVALRTPIDVDEGFYALASELVASGKTPYADFFYPQAPLHPYVLAPIIAALGPRFVVLRVVSALLAAGATTLVAHAPEERARLHLTTEDDLKATMRAGAASVVVLDRETPPERKPWEDLLTSSGYRLEKSVGDVAIYVR